jgi:hypothetical protein
MMNDAKIRLGRTSDRRDDDMALDEVEGILI